jgi:hypothetical protein
LESTTKSSRGKRLEEVEVAVVEEEEEEEEVEVVAEEERTGMSMKHRAKMKGAERRDMLLLHQ